MLLTFCASLGLPFPGLSYSGHIVWPVGCQCLASSAESPTEKGFAGSVSVSAAGCPERCPGAAQDSTKICPSSGRTRLSVASSIVGVCLRIILITLSVGRWLMTLRPWGKTTNSVATLAHSLLPQLQAIRNIYYLIYLRMFFFSLLCLLTK